MKKYITILNYQGVKIDKDSSMMRELLDNGFVLNVYDEAVKVFEGVSDEFLNDFNSTLNKFGFKTFLE